jgi:hypothetical protein
MHIKDLSLVDEQKCIEAAMLTNVAGRMSGNLKIAGWKN